MSDLEKTIHYTTQAEKICGNLKKYIPEDAFLIEPFVGDGDLLSIFPKNSWEVYDIAPTGKENVIIQQKVLLKKRLLVCIFLNFRKFFLLGLYNV